MAFDKITQAMYDDRRKCPLCKGAVRIVIRYTQTFGAECRICHHTWELKTPMTMLKRDPLQPTIKCSRQAIREWNRLADIMSWRSKYWDSGDGSLMRDVDRDDDGTPVEEIGRYEVVFDFENVRYYCYIDAVTSDEAMSVFMKSHPGITMKHVVDILEI